MNFAHLILFGSTATLTFASPLLLPRQSNTTATTNCTSWPEPKLGIAQVMKNWGTVWAGNHSESIVNHTISPDVSLWMDRLPVGSPFNATTAAVSVSNSTELLKFVSESRTGFSSYKFTNNFYFVSKEGDKLATRWTLNAIVGNDTLSPIRKAGDVVKMNGTDILLFDGCSGRIQQVLTAQDTLEYLRQLGTSVSSSDWLV